MMVAAAGYRRSRVFAETWVAAQISQRSRKSPRLAFDGRHIASVGRPDQAHELGLGLALGS